jgi:nitrite reductase/ring-hydroxylating ferredoxin subunit
VLGSEKKQDGSSFNQARRDFFSKITSFLMAGGLIAGYGTFLSYAARFLYPGKRQPKAWLFVTELRDMASGSFLSYTAPTGAKIAIARKGDSGAAEDFIALSSTCPHLGCQVQWQHGENRFFCPCHNGVFRSDGVAVSGPPAEAKQRLLSYPLKVENGLLFVEAPVEGLASPGGFFNPPPGPGHLARPSALTGPFKKGISL